MMAHRPLLWSLGLVALFELTSMAGYDSTTYVYKSAEQEKSSTHILVGTIRHFHPWNEKSTKGQLYAAELVVAGVEKGEGVRPGDVVNVRFHTNRSSEDLERGTMYPFDCGPPIVKQEPGRGSEARVYALLNDDYQYVADFPESFFGIKFQGVQRQEPRTERASSALWNQRASLIGSSVIMIGLVAGYAIRARTARR